MSIKKNIARAIVIGSIPVFGLSLLYSFNKSKLYDSELANKITEIEYYENKLSKPICPEGQKSRDNCNSIEDIISLRENGGLEGSINWSKSQRNQGCNLFRSIPQDEEFSETSPCVENLIGLIDSQYFGVYDEFYKGYKAILGEFRKNSDLRDGYFQFGREYCFITKELKDNIASAKKPSNPLLPISGLGLSLLGAYLLTREKKT